MTLSPLPKLGSDARVADTAKAQAAANPAADMTEFGVTRENRQSLGSPRANLHVPEMPGWHLHWFRGMARAEQAKAAGFVFVKKGEVPVPNHGIGADQEIEEGEDLGSIVTKLAKGEDMEGGQATRMYLMKMPQAWRDDDLKAREKRSDMLIDQLRRGEAADKEGNAARRDQHRRVMTESRNFLNKRSS